jgi:hypothetical protein
LGFIKKENKFIKIEEGNNDTETETESLNTNTSDDESIGSNDTWSSDDEDDDDNNNENDSIVTEDETEEFKKSECTCDLCEDMHRCQHLYNNWTPSKDSNEYKIKQFMENLEFKVKHEIMKTD